VAYLQPILLLNARNKRTTIKAKYSHLSARRGGELKLKTKLNGWAAHSEDPVYAGFKLELAGAERPGNNLQTVEHDPGLIAWLRPRIPHGCSFPVDASSRRLQSHCAKWGGHRLARFA
jgi:hypothetical protein